MTRSRLLRTTMLGAAVALPGPAATAQPAPPPRPASSVAACPARPGWATLPAGRVAAHAGPRRVLNWIGVHPGGGLSWNGSPLSRHTLGQYLQLVAAMRPQPASVVQRVPGAGCDAVAELAALVEATRLCRPDICILTDGIVTVRVAPPAPPPPPRPPSYPAARPEPAVPRMNLHAYFSSGDYPPAALRANEEGTVYYRLQVGVDGRVRQCTIRVSSGSALLDAATCRILASRARFTPARGAAGDPVEDSVDDHITWRLAPEPEPEPPPPPPSS